MKEIPTIPVPCNGCTACCRGGCVFLDPVLDDATQYECSDAPNLFGRPMLALNRKPGTDECVYLGPEGCTIHGRAPAACRTYDCRVMLKMYGPTLMRDTVLYAARERLHTLDKDEEQ